MKQYFVQRLAIAGLAILSVPGTLLAQNEKEKVKEKREVEQIIITRRGDADAKTVIEIDGDKIKVNGKDLDKTKDGEVTVRRNKVRDYQALTRAGRPGTQVWNFDMGENGVSLFREDANRAMLGVVTEEDDKGARITSITKESAAEKAGLKTGDIITKIENDKIDDASDVADAVHDRKPGDKVAITVLRNGKEQKINAELGKWKGVAVPSIQGRIMTPGDIEPMAPPAPPFAGTFSMGGQPRLGLSVQDTEDGTGVKVLDVSEESNAAKAGIKEDDVITHINDKAVNSADELARSVRENREKTSFTLKLQRNGKAQTVEVRTPRRLKTANL